MQLTFSDASTAQIIKSVSTMRRAHERYKVAIQNGDDRWADLFEEYLRSAAGLGMTIDSELNIMNIEIPIWQESE